MWNKCLKVSSSFSIETLKSLYQAQTESQCSSVFSADNYADMVKYVAVRHPLVYSLNEHSIRIVTQYKHTGQWRQEKVDKYPLVLKKECAQ